MRKTSLVIGLAFVLASAGLCLPPARANSLQQADPAISATRVYGKVTEINTSAGTLNVKTDAGSVVVVNTNEKTTFQRMPPGETDRAKAEATSLTEITVGDGIYALGYVAADRKSVPAQKIYVVSQSDIAKRNAAERAKWATGVKGVVSAVNPTTKEFTVTSRSLMGASQAVTVASEKAKLKRYPPDSIPKYVEAKASKFEDVKVGDQLAARGEKSPDGMHLNAEEIVSGSFKVVGGTITAIDPATNEVHINDLQTKKPLTIMLRPDSVIRRFPQGGPGMFGGGGGQGGANGGARPGAGAQGPGGQGPTAQGAGTQGPGAQGPGGQGPRPGGGMSMADLLERLPIISASDLKVGDMIILSSTQGSDPARLTAISMVAGIEPLLQMMAARQGAGGAQPRPQDLNSNFGGMFGGVGVP